MHEYDIALKAVIQRLSDPVLESITGYAVKSWHNVELPEVRTLRADMIGETSDGRMIHLELQSSNDSEMALRMAEYALAICRRFRRLPEQIVLYVGQEPMRMIPSLQGTALSFHFRIVDLRELDGEPLLASSNLEDNVIAVLMRLSNQRETVRRILRQISDGEPSSRGMALRELTILAGLRSLGDTIRQETTKMPILNDIMDHDFLGPQLRKASLEGEQTVVMRQIEKRFGSVPPWVRQRLAPMSESEVEETALRLLDARSLEDLFNN